MYEGKYEGKHRKAAAHARGSGRLMAMFLAAVLLFALPIGGTLAWLSTQDEPIQNTFYPSAVACAVEETFNDSTGVKTDVNVKNTGTIDAFIRVKLVTYRTNDQGRHIGGIAQPPVFALGEGWVAYDGYYYYTKPVAPDGMPENNLTGLMTLCDSYVDADGGKQAVDVMAEAIQSVPEEAVKAAWGAEFSINADGSLSVPTN